MPKTSGVFPFADDLPDKCGRAIVVEVIPSGQFGLIRFRSSILTAFTGALNPIRTAKIFAQQASKTCGDTIEFGPDELMDLRR
jgi:hypothetical protein